MASEATLYARMEVRLAEAEKKLDRFQSRVDKNMGGIERSTRKAARTMETSLAASAAKIGSAFKGVGAGLLAGVAAGGVAGLVGTFRGIATSIAEIGAEAQRAGLSTKAFQELKFIAEQNSVSVDALTDGMKELSLRTDEFIVSGGKAGSAAEAFQRLGFTVEELKTKIKDPSALLTEIIGKVQTLDKAAQVRIFDELFGGEGGEQFVRLIAQGEVGIRDTIKAANDLNAVISDDIIKSAAEVDAKFQAIATTISQNLKAAVVEAFDYLQRFIESYREFQNQRSTTLQGEQSDIMGQRNALAGRMDQIRGNGRLTEAAKNKALGALQIQMDALNKREDAIIGILSDRANATPYVKPPTDVYNGGRKPQSTSSSGSKSPDALARASQSLRDQISLLQAQTDAQRSLNPLVDDYGFAMEKASAKQDLLNAALEAGKTITPELAAQIDGMATAYANAQVAANKLDESQDRIRQNAEEMAEFQKDLTRGMVDGFLEGKKAADIFADSLKKVGDRLLDMALNSIFDSPSKGGMGGFDLFGSLGSFLGIGRREKGGPVSAGQPYIVGEKRPELFIPSQSGTIIPKLPKMGGGSGSNSFTFAPVIDARGADVAAVAKLERLFEKSQKDFGRNVVAVIKDAQTRNIKI